ncbi:LOB domain-containing protein 1 [Vitis vinifera]|uniref:LOB domain-containing protein 11 n=2 Tax=Vitis vinifera TaxID=29760 RepID=A0A438IFC0_VITVI|nr:LOB domain-containing protein 1 [Vitis vinifera]RVW95443.1 LOB domain-containing protein 11 [Vitis vinifera]|eukprot:XP_002265542.1 PREDICTED: LOB domain-containing protein 1 [Vitis vinifera]
METSNMAAQVPPRARTHQPCAACRMLRRRCDRDCILAPYFPSYEIEKFAGVHKVFGASNVIKMIQMVEESRREDAVKAIIYEATTRLRDPVYGSAGAIFHLQKMIQDLNTQLDSIRTQTLVLREQRDQLLGILKNVHRRDPVSPIDFPTFGDAGSLSIDDTVGCGPSSFPSDCDWIL